MTARRRTGLVQVLYRCENYSAVLSCGVTHSRQRPEDPDTLSRTVLVC